MENITAFTSPLASANYGAINVPPQVELVVDALSRVSFWTVLWTVLALAVVYDQRTLARRTCPENRRWPDADNCLAVSYIRNKGSIVGPSWKIPFMGPFLESVNPKFEEYQAKWASGELSCVSVFHK